MSADSWLYSDEEVADVPPMELRDSLKKNEEMRSVCVWLTRSVIERVSRPVSWNHSSKASTMATILLV